MKYKFYWQNKAAGNRRSAFVATCVEEGSCCGTALVDGAGLVMVAEGGRDREPAIVVGQPRWGLSLFVIWVELEL